MLRNRTFIVFVLSFIFAVFVSIWMNAFFPIALVLFLLALGVVGTAFVFTDYKKLCVALAVLGCFSGNLYATAYQQAVALPAKAFIGAVQTVDATLLQEPDVYEDSQRVLVKVTSEKQSFRTLCYLPLTDTPLKSGDALRMQVQFYEFTDSEGFDRAAFRASQGVFVGASLVEDDNGNPVMLDVTPHEQNPLQRYPNAIRSAVRDKTLAFLPAREGGLLLGILIGDSTGISTTDNQAFQKAGLSHIIVVSGMHIGFLVAFCNMLLGKRWGGIASIIMILLFIPIVGATPSVVRASVMYMVSAGSFLASKKHDSLQALFFALFLLVLQNPYCILGVGLQLSFASTLGLQLYATRIDAKMMGPFQKTPRALQRVLRVFTTAIACSIAANLFTIPIVLSTFGYVSVLSIISNVLVTGVVAVCFIGGILLTLAGFVWAGAARAIAVVLKWCLGYMLAVGTAVANVPFALVSLQNTLGMVLVVLSMVGVVIWIYGGHIKIIRRGLCVALPLGIILMFVNSYAQNQFYQVTYLPTGNGQAILVSYRHEELIAIDCSASGRKDAAQLITEWMSWNGYDKIDCLVLTAVDKGHANGLQALAASTDIAQFYVPAGYKSTKHNTAIIDVLEAHADAVTQVESDTALETQIPVSLLYLMAGKLAVRIDAHTLVLQSPTEKQLASYREAHALAGVDTLVVSPALFYDDAIMQSLYEELGMREVVLETGMQAELTSNQFEVQSTYAVGEITKQYKVQGGATIEKE